MPRSGQVLRPLAWLLLQITDRRIVVREVTWPAPHSRGARIP